jgi:hypothetical protein
VNSDCRLDDYDAFSHAAEQAIHDVDHSLAQHLRVLALFEISARLGYHRYMVERTFAWLTRYARLTIWYERRTDLRPSAQAGSGLLRGFGSLEHPFKSRWAAASGGHTPLRAAWKTGTAAAPLLADFNSRMRAALFGNSASLFWDGDAAGVVGPDAFFDSIHLRWSAAGVYTRALGKALQPVPL